jgi:hypothetical protein
MLASNPFLFAGLEEPVSDIDHFTAPEMQAQSDDA